MNSGGQNNPKTTWKIVTLPRLQVDAIVSCFLLKYFGDEHFPGIKDNVEYHFLVNVPEGKDPIEMEKQGHILLDMGGGKFDHHKDQDGVHDKCVSQLVAEYLGVQSDRPLKKLIDYAWRDDIKGKGTISEDPIDRAFGLSGLINNLNRMLPDDQEMVLNTVMPLLLAHYLEEKKRAEDLPAEYKKQMDGGKVKITMVQGPRGSVKMVLIETDEIAMAGFLRARREINADIVVQKMSSGHVNVVTQQKRMFDLSNIARLLRKKELQVKGEKSTLSDEELGAAGRVNGVDEWFFDTRARTIQNGGIRPQGTVPTRLSLLEIENVIKEAAATKL